MVTLSRLNEPRPAQTAILIGNAASFIGAVVFVLSALTMVVLWVRLLFAAMNWLGLFLGLITTPFAVGYPFLHWLAHREFSAVIFTVWLLGLLGLCATMLWASWGRYRVVRGAANSRPGTAILAAEEAD